jgi:hypothetical protein
MNIRGLYEYEEGPQVRCTNYMGFIFARSKKIQKHNFSFLTTLALKFVYSL